MEGIKHFIDVISKPQIMFTAILLGFFFIFPVNNWFYKWNQRLKIDRIWSKTGGLVLFSFMTLFFSFGLTDQSFRLIVLKPDNLPILGLIYLSIFFAWFSMHQATKNDKRLEAGQKSIEFEDAKEKVLVWPDLVYIEFISLILLTVFLIVWGLAVPAPLEEAANPTHSPNPAKAPWYFLALQEMLVYFDPWIAGVVIPTVMVLGLMAIPYIDPNRKTSGYYCFKERKMAISIFMFGWLVLWVFLIIVGTFLRGPNWNFFGPFEAWDVNKLEALTNINLSEYIYMIWFKTSLPKNILIREIGGILLLGTYFLGLPLILTKTVLKDLFKELGVIRYSTFVMLLLCAASLPIKMYLRWAFNLKYIVAIPEFFFNI